MLEIRETTLEDLKNIQRLWGDGEVMRFVGFPEGLNEPEEALRAIALYRRLGFTQKDMPAHVIAQGEDPETNLYFELHRN